MANSTIVEVLPVIETVDPAVQAVNEMVSLTLFFFETFKSFKYVNYLEELEADEEQVTDYLLDLQLAEIAVNSTTFVEVPSMPNAVLKLEGWMIPCEGESAYVGTIYIVRIIDGKQSKEPFIKVYQEWVFACSSPFINALISQHKKSNPKWSINSVTNIVKNRLTVKSLQEKALAKIDHEMKKTLLNEAVKSASWDGLEDFFI